MTLRGDDDDTSRGRITQGGHRDAASPGPARRSGRSFWWFAVVLVVSAVVAVAWIGAGSRGKAPSSRGGATLSQTLAPAASKPVGGAGVVSPASGR